MKFQVRSSKFRTPIALMFRSSALPCGSLLPAAHAPASARNFRGLGEMMEFGSIALMPDHAMPIPLRSRHGAQR